ncbi:MAG: carboxypeptidase-like regulatory domain-containing protein [Thermodesulfobacteriota bacterium]
MGYTGTLTFVNSPSTSYDWIFSDGFPKAIHVDNSSQVTWEARVTIISNDAPNQVVVSATDGIIQTPVTKELSVYSFPKIADKEKIPSIYMPGTHSQSVYGENAITAYGGKYQSYYWTQEGPAYPTPKNGGVYHYTVFSAPLTGTYAGEYTITITDGLPGTDSVNVWVPVQVNPGPLFILNGSSPVTYTIAGAPDGTFYTAKLLNGESSTAKDVTGDPNYGTVTVQPGPSVNGVFNIFYTPPANATTFLPFYIHCTPDRTLNAPDYGNVYLPLPYGPMLIRDVRNYAGTLRDQTTLIPITNVKVSLTYPKAYAQTVFSDANGQFVFQGLPTGNLYYFWTDVNGYQSTSFTSTLLVSGNPANSNVLLKPSNPAAHVRGTVRKPDGSAFLPDEMVSVGLVHWYDENGTAQVETLAETTVGGGTFTLELAEVPPDPPNPGVDTYVLMAYREGQYTEVTLPNGTNFPYTGIALTLSNDYTGTTIGQLINNSRVLPVPPTGGFAMGSTNTVRDLVTNVVLRQEPGPSFELLPGGILMNLLTPPPPGRVRLTGHVDDNQKESTSYDSLIGISPSILAALFQDDRNPSDDILYKRPLVITLPIDLTLAYPGSFESQSLYVRMSDGSVVDLKSCQAFQLTADKIIALDYLGDGRTGTITAMVQDGSFFGAGYPCSPHGNTTKKTSFPDFDRYEFFGCFINSLLGK